MSERGIGQQIINGTYGLDNRPPTAYEELKAWCEKYLKPYCYIDTIAPGRFSNEQDAIVFPGWLIITFDKEGRVDTFSADD